MRKVIVNFSGGKDSTVAALEALKRYPKEEITLCFQDTGAEYDETEGHIRQIAQMLDLPLVILKPSRDWWQHIRERGYFPMPSVRSCTQELKVHVVRSWIRQNRESLGDELVVVSGIRADESLSRSKLPMWAEHETSLKGEDKQKVYRWFPCHEMTSQEVFERIRAEGLPLHPCYDFSSRLSCWCCIFAKKHEVRAYAEMRPDLYEKVCLLEDEVKHKWKPGFAINDLMKQGRLL